MAPEQMVGLGLFVVLAVGACAALWLSPSRRRRRQLRDTPRVPIGALVPGTVARVEGTVVLDDAVESPVARRRCAYWRLRVSFREYSTSREGMAWYQSIDRQARRSFRVRDATGTVRIACEGARFELLPAVDRPAEHEIPELPEHVARFLAGEGVPLKRKSGQPQVFGFEEETLVEGMPIQVIGQVEVGRDGLVLGTASVPAIVMEEEPSWL